MSQQPKAAATQEQPPVASSGTGRNAQQGEKPSSRAPAEKTSGQSTTSNNKGGASNGGGSSMTWAARLAQGNGSAKPEKPQSPPPNPPAAAGEQPSSQQQQQPAAANTTARPVTGVKLPVGVTAAGKDNINFGSFDPTELEQQQQQTGTQPPPPQQQKQQPNKDAANKPSSNKGSFAAAASGTKQQQHPTSNAPAAPTVQQQQQQQQRGSYQGQGGQQASRTHRAQPVQAVQIPQGGAYGQQPFMAVQSIYGGQPYVPTTAFMQAAGPTGYYAAGGFPQSQYPTGYYGSPAQGAPGVPTGGQAVGGSGAAVPAPPQGATQYPSTPSSPLPVKPPTQPPVRQKKILRIENPDTHEVLNLAAVASEVSKQDKAAEEKAAAAIQQQAPAVAPPAPPPPASPATEADGKSFKEAMLAAAAAAEGKEAAAPKPVKEMAPKAEEKPAVQEAEPAAAPEEPAVSEQSTTTTTPFGSAELQLGSLGDEPDMSSGRKRYSRGFLLGFRDMSLCKQLPPAIEVATLSALAFTGERQNSAGQPGADTDWKSSRMGPPPGGPPGMRANRSQSGRMRGPIGIDSDTWERGKALPPAPIVGYGGRGPPPGMRATTGPLPALHKTESAYKIGRAITDDPEEEKAQKALKSMLNKITPQNFGKITAQIIDKMNERKKAITLQGFIDQIFDKALTETTFAELYADLVSKLSPALPELEDEDGNPVQFRRTLLNKCQEEFETGAIAMKAVAEREKRQQSGEEKVEVEEVEEPEAKEEGETEESGVTEAELEKRNAAAEAKKQDKEAAEAEVKARKRMLGNIIFVGQLYRFGVLTETVMHSCIQQLLEETEHPRPEDVECLCKLLTTVGRPMDSSERVVKSTEDVRNLKTKDMMEIYFRRIEALVRNEALDSRHRFMLADLVDLRKNNWVLRRKTEGPKKIEDIHRDAAMERSRSQMLDRQASRSRDTLHAARPPYDNRVDAPIRTLNRASSQDSFSGHGQSFRPGGRPPPSRPAPPPPERTTTPPMDEVEEGEIDVETQGPAAPVDVHQKVKGMLEEVYNSGNEISEGLLSLKELVDAGADQDLLTEECLAISLDMKGTNWDTLTSLLVEASDTLPIEALETGSRQLLNRLDDLTVDAPKAPSQLGKVIAGLIVAYRLPGLSTMAKHIKEADAEPEEGEEPMSIESGVAAKVLGAMLQSLHEQEGFDLSTAWKEVDVNITDFLPENDRNAKGIEDFISTYSLSGVLSTSS